MGFVSVTALELQAVLEDHCDPLLCGAFSPDGGLDGTVRIWVTLQADQLIERARTRAFRTLTDDERLAYGLSVRSETAP